MESTRNQWEEIGGRLGGNLEDLIPIGVGIWLIVSALRSGLLRRSPEEIAQMEKYAKLSPEKIAKVQKSTKLMLALGVLSFVGGIVNLGLRLSGTSVF